MRALLVSGLVAAALTTTGGAQRAPCPTESGIEGRLSSKAEPVAVRTDRVAQ
jgi:hypothetical protein